MTAVNDLPSSASLFGPGSYDNLLPFSSAHFGQCESPTLVTEVQGFRLVLGYTLKPNGTFVPIRG